jgi:hypothetical protein
MSSLYNKFGVAEPVITPPEPFHPPSLEFLTGLERRTVTRKTGQGYKSSADTWVLNGQKLDLFETRSNG